MLERTSQHYIPHSEAAKLQFKMADDSMEISSENGQPGGDDIDIDIDLTAGQPDEDYILNDALSTVDYGNDFPAQLSPALHHDDLMVDDDNASYQMDDADAIHDDGAEQNAEPESMSFAQSEILYEGGDDVNTANTFIQSEDHDIGLFFGQHDGHDMDPTSGQLAPESENVSHHDNATPISNDVIAHEDNIPANELGLQVEEVERGDLQHESQRFQEPSGSPPATKEEAKSPPTSIFVPGPSSPAIETDTPTSDPTRGSHGEAAKVEDSGSTGCTYNPSKAREVKVVYQSVEYALFSTSDLDDPDSFFLSDISIIEKPLDQFFQAIREIIRDDLTAEEELCLNVEDLGLETEEVNRFLPSPVIGTNIFQASSIIRDVTLAQILNLHERLLLNDGVDSAAPLYLLLGTRVNFTKRFSSLTESAALGQGLSQLSGLESNSDKRDDVEDGDEDGTNIESNLKTHEIAEDAEGTTAHGIEHEKAKNQPSPVHVVDSLEIFEKEVHADGEDGDDRELHDEKVSALPESQEDHEEQSPKFKDEHREYHRDGSEHQPEDHSPALVENFQDSEGANLTSKSKSNFEQESTSKSTDTTEPLPGSAENITRGADNHEEEEDLIDYSDEEIQDPDEGVGRSTAIGTDENRTDTGTYHDFISSCLKPKTCFCSECSLLILAEYQAKDEELRRRSLSRQAEEKLLQQATAQTFTNANGDHPEDYVDEGKDAGYEDYSTELQEDDTSATYEQVEHSNESNLAAYDGQNGSSNEPEGYVEEGGDYEHEDYQATSHDDYGIYDDLSAEEPGSESLPIYAGEHASNFAVVNDNHDENGRPAPSTVSSLGAAETAESSITLGAEELQYEDDLEEEISNELETELATTPTNGAALEQKDEIDYEDDEDEETPISVGPGAVPATNEPSNPNGKRSIAEVESAILTSSKGELRRIIKRRLH